MSVKAPSFDEDLLKMMHAGAPDRKRVSCFPCSIDKDENGTSWSYVTTPPTTKEEALIRQLSNLCGWPRPPQVGDYLQAKPKGTVARPQPTLKEFTEYSPNGTLIDKLQHMQTIGPILEIRSVQYPKVGKVTPKVGIAVLVPATNPEPGARLVVVNISSGTTKFANLITDREVVKSAQVLCRTAR